MYKKYKDFQNKETNIIRFDEPMQKVWDYALYLVLSHCCEKITCITPKHESYLHDLYDQLSENKQYHLIKKCIYLANNYLFNRIPSEFWTYDINIKLIRKNDIFRYNASNIAIYNITHIILENKDYELSVSSSLFPSIMWNNTPSMKCYLRPKHPSPKCTISYDYWQMECCGHKFEVGDKVHWLVSACMYDNDNLPDSFDCNYSYEAHNSSYKNLEVLDGTIRKIYAKYYNDQNPNTLIQEIKCSNNLSMMSALRMQNYIIEVNDAIIKPATYLDFWNITFNLEF